MIRIGVIGYGYWGPNLVRNFSDVATARVTAVCDRDARRLAQVERRYPGVTVTTAAAELIADPNVDAVIIATPLEHHYDLAISALQQGKHVLVEKPMTATSSQAARLIEEAARRRLVLMVDHTFVYTGAVEKMHELTRGGELGDIYYYDSVRINLGLFQRDANVLWDLAVHDLSIMDYVLSTQPVAVSATGLSHVQNRPHNIAYMTMFFDST
jgi:predicted dehydrogenase